MKGSSLELGKEYFVHYIFPNKARKEAKAETVTEHELLVKDSPGRVFVCILRWLVLSQRQVLEQ